MKQGQGSRFGGLAKCLSATIALFLLSTPHVYAEASSSGEDAVVSQQIHWLDLEILLLKAELAQKSSQVADVKHYVDELKSESIPEHLKGRYEALQTYLEKQQSSPVLPQPSFQFNPGNIIVLLPLTGAYEQAGTQILAGLKLQLPDVELQVIDTAIYEDPMELWELVKLYQPSFIFGPLRKEFAQGFAKIETLTPTLMFNTVETAFPYVKSLSPGRSPQMVGLVDIIQKKGYHKVLLLSSVKAKEQEDAFRQAWANLALEDRFELLETPMASSVDETLSQVLGATYSDARRLWLQKTLGEKLEEGVRVRQDIDLVVSMLPFRGALQVSPLLKYYHLNQVLHLWVPIQLPTLEVFSSNLPFWQATQAMLPKYYMQQLQKLSSSSPSNLAYEPVSNTVNTKNPGHNSENPDIGIFYAMGSVAAELVKKMTDTSIQQMETSLGKVQWDEQKNILLQPSFYWLDKGDIAEQYNQTK